MRAAVRRGARRRYGAHQRGGGDAFAAAVSSLVSKCLGHTTPYTKTWVRGGRGGKALIHMWVTGLLPPGPWTMPAPCAEGDAERIILSRNCSKW